MTIQPGGFWRRVVALLIDGLLIWGVEQVLARVVGISEVLKQGILNAEGNVSFTHEQLIAHATIFGIGTITTVSYAVIFYRWKNATLGKLALGLKVVDARTGARLGIGQTILRESIVGKDYHVPSAASLSGAVVANEEVAI